MGNILEFKTQELDFEEGEEWHWQCDLCDNNTFFLISEGGVRCTECYELSEHIGCFEL